MKSFIFFIFVCVTFSATVGELKELSLEFINEINQKQSSWTAGRNFPENITREYLRKLNGALGMHPDPIYKPIIKRHIFNLTDIPEAFDARAAWPFCPSINRVRNQGACGSCWAFASAESMTDRTCIHSSGNRQFTYSPEDLLSCCSDCGTCNGGYPMAAFNFWINVGVVSGGDIDSNEGCRPYTADAFNTGQTPACIQSCQNGYPVNYFDDKYYGRQSYSIYNSIDQIQYEILTNGPVVVNYEVFQDFYNYQGGVYRYVSGESAGFHVVKIIGWGVENGLPYWLIANSWGSGWGDTGFFKILRGANECGIENYPVAALPYL